ncbi:unnamed protein product, partial [Didymodactylos carnosus]
QNDPIIRPLSSRRFVGIQTSSLIPEQFQWNQQYNVGYLEPKTMNLSVLDNSASITPSLVSDYSTGLPSWMNTSSAKSFIDTRTSSSLIPEQYQWSQQSNVGYLQSETAKTSTWNDLLTFLVDDCSSYSENNETKWKNIFGSNDVEEPEGWSN